MIEVFRMTGLGLCFLSTAKLQEVGPDLPNLIADLSS